MRGLPARYEREWGTEFWGFVNRALAPGVAVLDVGGGRRPTIAPEERPDGSHYVGLDVPASQPETAPPGPYGGEPTTSARFPDCARCTFATRTGRSGAGMTTSRPTTCWPRGSPAGPNDGIAAHPRAGRGRDAEQPLLDPAQPLQRARAAAPGRAPRRLLAARACSPGGRGGHLSPLTARLAGAIPHQPALPARAFPDTRAAAGGGG